MEYVPWMPSLHANGVTIMTPKGPSVTSHGQGARYPVTVSAASPGDVFPHHTRSRRYHVASNSMIRRFSPGDLSCAWPRAMAILGAVIATLVIYLVTTYVGQVDLTVNDGETKVGAAEVVFATLVAGLVAWGLLALLERSTDRAWPIFRAIAIAVLVLSMLGTLGADEALGKTALSVMHVFAAVIIVRGFSRTTRRR